MTAKYSTLLVNADESITRITINRPDQLNSLNPIVIDELQQALHQISQERPATRVVTLEGAGTKAFVAGADISAMTGFSADQAAAFAQRGQALSKHLEAMPQIIVAKVRGFALGGGCELAMACDLIVAGKTARFGQPEVNLGLIAGFGGTQRLARRVGLPVALDMLCSGRARMLSAEEAAHLGLISRVVEDADLDREVDQIIEGILKAAPRAVAESKRLARASYSMSLDAGLAAEASAFANCFARSEAREGTQAFLEKRKPNFI